MNKKCVYYCEGPDDTQLIEALKSGQDLSVQLHPHPDGRKGDCIIPLDISLKLMDN